MRCGPFRLTGTCRCLVALLLLAPVAGDAQQPFHRGHAFDQDGAVRILALEGSIRVIGWDRDSVDFRGTIADGLRPFAMGNRSGYKMSTYEGVVTTSAPSHLTVRVPTGAQLWIKTTNAKVTIEGLNGALDVFTIGGAIDITGSVDALVAETLRGALTVRGRMGWLRLRAGSGAVQLHDLVARDLSVSTVTGNISGAWQAERSRMESMSGNVDLTFRGIAGAAAEIDTHRGTVTVRTPSPRDVVVRLYSQQGAITNRWTSNLPRPLTPSGNELEFGQGFAKLTVRTFAGAIVLSGQ